MELRQTVKEMHPGKRSRENLPLYDSTSAVLLYLSRTIREYNFKDTSHSPNFPGLDPPLTFSIEEAFTRSPILLITSRQNVLNISFEAAANVIPSLPTSQDSLCVVCKYIDNNWDWAKSYGYACGS